MPHSGILDGIGVFSWLTGWWKKWIYKLDPNRWLHMFGTRLVCLSPLAVNIFELFIFSAMHQTQYRHQPPSFSIHIIYNILYFQPSSYIYIYIYCIFGLRHRSVASRPPDGQCRKDSWQKPWPIQTDDQRFGHGHPNWGIPGLALPKENKDMMQFRRVHITLAMKGDRILNSFVFFSLLKITIFQQVWLSADIK